MAFDPNRDIKIEASETEPGQYTLRTRGLAERKRPELEIAGVPAVALNAAGGVINIIAEYTVNKAEVLDGQSVGNVLSVGDDGAKLLLAVRAASVVAPTSGFWGKLGGGSKGVLRLVDLVPDGELGPPRTALATMLVHRAAVRVAKNDGDGARTELEAALVTLPGEPGAGAAPSIGGAASGTYNWQNHLAYLELATLDEGDVDAAAAHFGDALARSPELAQDELGATWEELTSFASFTSGGALEREARRIVHHNLEDVRRGPGPTKALATLASPIWERDASGRAVRRTSLMPAELGALYYEGAARDRLAREGASLASRILARDETRPWRPAWIARPTRGVWVSKEAPLSEPFADALPAHGILSAILADVARCFRAGATEEEILARFEAPEGPHPALDALAQKLAVLERWEGEQYMAAMTLRD